MTGFLLVACCTGAFAADNADLEDLEARRSLLEELTAGRAFLDPIRMPGGDQIFAQCVDWGNAAYMLPLSLTTSELESFVEQLPVERDRRYQPFSHYWARTATDGNVVVPGQRITLTWSLVPDGTEIRNQFGGWQVSFLHGNMSVAFQSQDLWKEQFRRAFDEFGELIGVNYVEVSDDGAPQGAPGVLGVRGDVRISMIDMSTLDSPGPLAWNYYPIPSWQLSGPDAGVGGDMVFNDFFRNQLASPAGQYRLLRNVIMHEHGHGIGFRHVDPINQTKLMEAIATTAFDGPQEDDIRGFQSAYGDRFEINAAPWQATVLPELPVAPHEGPLVFENLALENASARDYFRFHVPDLTVLAVRAEPVGTRYLQGPQGGSLSWVNGDAVLDIVVELLDSTGTQVIRTVDQSGLGGSEQLDYPLLDGGGEYLFRVRSKGNVNQSQRYRLEVSRREGVAEATYVALEPVLDDSGGNSSGRPDPGERNIELAIPLQNMGFSPGPEFVATLVSDTPTVTITQPTAMYGPAAPTEETYADGPFRFNISGDHDCGEPIVFRLLKSLPNIVEESHVELGTGIIGIGDEREYPDSHLSFESLSYLIIAEKVVEDDFLVGEIALTNIHVTGNKLENHRFALRSPRGLEVVLSDGQFRGTYLIGTALRDGGSSIASGLPPFPGTYRPQQSFEALSGDSAQGVWQLRVFNKTGARAAEIEAWTLELRPYHTEPYCDPPLVIVPGDIRDAISIY